MIHILLQICLFSAIIAVLLLHTRYLVRTFVAIGVVSVYVFTSLLLYILGLELEFSILVSIWLTMGTTVLFDSYDDTIQHFEYVSYPPIFFNMGILSVILVLGPMRSLC